MIIKLISCALTLFYVANASRILAVIPSASFSHQVFYRPIWKELANRGHELVLLTTDPMKDASVKNLREIDLSSAYACKTGADMQEILKADQMSAIPLLMEMIYKATEIEFSLPEVKALFKNKNEHFDLLMLECVTPIAYVFKHRFDVPTICLTSLDAADITHDLMGNAVHMIQYPNFLMPFSEQMNFFERLATVGIMRVINVYMMQYIVPRIDTILRESLEEDLPSVADLFDKVDMLFTNSNPLFATVRPYAPATISIAGGLHETPKSNLPKDLKDFLDGAKDGAIYFSLGSNVKSNEISPETRKVVIETFRQLPYKVLWKFEDDELPGLPANVKISKWLPQQDVLRHKNTKLFVTQAGMQSLEEALYAKVPMVAIPYFGDQESNAKRMAQKGIGLDLDHKTLTVAKFKTALLEVMHNDKYRNKVQELADLIQDVPMKPLEKAVWWTEYVLRHKGAQHLKGPRLPLWQYYYLDLFAVVGVILGLIAYVTKKCLCCVCKLVCGKFCNGKSTGKANGAKNNKKKSKSKRE